VNIQLSRAKENARQEMSRGAGIHPKKLIKKQVSTLPLVVQTLYSGQYKLKIAILTAIIVLNVKVMMICNWLLSKLVFASSNLNKQRNNGLHIVKLLVKFQKMRRPVCCCGFTAADNCGNYNK
jgi:hypothetical protein